MKCSVGSVRSLALGVFLGGTVFGQAVFQDLATNGDGSVLYFSSILRLKGTDQYPYPKIFAWTEKDGVRLHEQRESGPVYSAGPGSWRSVDAYRLTRPTVSSDGGTIALTGVRDCNWGTPCGTSIERYEATIYSAGKERNRTPGAATLSPNGRYALLTTSVAALVMRPRTRLLDLQTGGEVVFDGFNSSLPVRHRVSNDGSVVMLFNGLELWRAGQRRTFRTVSAAGSPMINDSATRIVYSGYAAGAPRLIAYDVQSGSETELATGAAPFGFDISIDASVIAFIEAGRAWVVGHDGSGRRPVIEALDSVADLALSGDGRVLFATTDTNRILRVDLRTSTGKEIVAATPDAKPQFINRSLEPGRGSLYQLTGERLPVVERVRLQARSIAVTSSSSTATLFQIPWETSADAEDKPNWIELDLPDNPESPFDSSFVAGPAWVRSVAPLSFTYEGNILAAHQDFSALVTEANPARPGEILHVYAAGFGPVSPKPATGEPAPSDPLAVATEPITCELETKITQNVDLLFAGLAPGMIGVYQVDVRLPRTLDAARGILRFRVGASIYRPGTGGRFPLEQVGP